MKRLPLTVAAAALLLGSMALSASAQTQSSGAASMQALKNATPVVTQAACNGHWGPYCPPGTVRACGPWRCWCRPCW